MTPETMDFSISGRGPLAGDAVALMRDVDQNKTFAHQRVPTRNVVIATVAGAS